MKVCENKDKFVFLWLVKNTYYSLNLSTKKY